ncbi:DNA-binding transcriptional LysR family regulator [Paraburkholderia silvatlantica]|nr:DNA-binding transcriptional LysR family regulator [Paraburkholderia silvatlantica]
MSGLVAIACVPSAVSFFLPGTVRTYHELYPGLRVRLIDETSSVVFLAVARGEADFGLTCPGTQEPDIEFTPILFRNTAAARMTHSGRAMYG